MDGATGIVFSICKLFEFTAQRPLENSSLFISYLPSGNEFDSINTENLHGACAGYKRLPMSGAPRGELNPVGWLADGSEAWRGCRGGASATYLSPCLRVTGPVLILLHPGLGCRDTRLLLPFPQSPLMPVQAAGGRCQPIETLGPGEKLRRGRGEPHRQGCARSSGSLCVQCSSLSFIYADDSLSKFLLNSW